MDFKLETLARFEHITVFIQSKRCQDALKDAEEFYEDMQQADVYTNDWSEATMFIVAKEYLLENKLPYQLVILVVNAEGGSYVIRKEDEEDSSRISQDGDAVVEQNIFVTLSPSAKHWTFKGCIIDPNDLYGSPDNPTVESDVRLVKSSGGSSSDTAFNLIRGAHSHFHFTCDDSHLAWDRRMAYHEEFLGLIDPVMLDPKSQEALHQPKKEDLVKISKFSLDFPPPDLTTPLAPSGDREVVWDPVVTQLFADFSAEDIKSFDSGDPDLYQSEKRATNESKRNKLLLSHEESMARDYREHHKITDMTHLTQFIADARTADGEEIVPLTQLVILGESKPAKVVKKREAVTAALNSEKIISHVNRFGDTQSARVVMILAASGWRGHWHGPKQLEPSRLHSRALIREHASEHNPAPRH